MQTTTDYKINFGTGIDSLLDTYDECDKLNIDPFEFWLKHKGSEGMKLFDVLESRYENFYTT